MPTILGVNHMFLYPESITDGKIHTDTLKKISESNLVDALDCWCFKENAKEEIRILKDSGKFINYNIGDRFGKKPVVPSSVIESEQIYAYDTIMEEIEYALEVGAKKIVFGSGPDDASDHKGALERFFEFTQKLLKQIPKNVTLCLEPTDWDIDKHFLLGRLSESVELTERIRKTGFENFGILLDMCHIPLMHETMESAVEKSKAVLCHIHLGNAVVKNKDNPFYGDKHIPWSYPESEYTEKDGVKFIRMLKNIGYLDNENATVSFEMRPYEGMDAESTLEKFVNVWKEA